MYGCCVVVVVVDFDDGYVGWDWYGWGRVWYVWIVWFWFCGVVVDDVCDLCGVGVVEGYWFVVVCVCGVCWFVCVWWFVGVYWVLVWIVWYVCVLLCGVCELVFDVWWDECVVLLDGGDWVCGLV